MHLEHFGDSYDIVKKSLLKWLQLFGKWSTHPMFTESASEREYEAFEKFLEARIISREVLRPDTTRSDYFACGHSCGNLFLDPTTGLCVERPVRRKGPGYLYISELIQLTERETRSLTMIFDQSFGRGKERAQLMDKLEHLLRHEVHAFAYCSHACFILASRDAAHLKNAYDHIMVESGLPPSRFLQVAAMSRGIRA